MSLVKKIFKPILKNQSSNVLFQYFLKQNHLEEFPLSLAHQSLIQLRETSQSEQHYFYYLVEDCIFSSVYATFYEEILNAISQNKSRAQELIDIFQKDQDERDQIVNQITQSHLSYLESKGHCDGCPHCDNHSDLQDILKAFLNGDISFFEKLYVGMQTIQFSMEALIYDWLILKPELLNSIDRNSVQSFRKELYHFCEKSVS